MPTPSRATPSAVSPVPLAAAAAAHGAADRAGVRVGCDVQSVADVDRAVAHFGSRYLDRVYTAAEQADCRTGGAASLAGRFAAKEAVLKLLGSADGIDPRAVEVLGGGARPRVRLEGPAARLAHRTRVSQIDVSISHDAGVAYAVAVAHQPAPHDQPAQHAQPAQPDPPHETPTGENR